MGWGEAAAGSPGQQLTGFLLDAAYELRRGNPERWGKLEEHVQGGTLQPALQKRNVRPVTAARLRQLLLGESSFPPQLP